MESISRSSFRNTRLSSKNKSSSGMSFPTPTIYLSTAATTLLCCLIMLTSTYNTVESASVIHHAKRSAVLTPQTNNDVPHEECSYGSPCGWEVYDPRTRNLEYYVQSSCKCKSKETCVQIDDDIMISAYVYKCRNIPRRNRPRHPSASSTGRTSDS